jgi:ATP-dependent DNA helicase RecG
VVLDDPNSIALENFAGVTTPMGECLKRLGLHTIGDLLLYFPRAYEDLRDLRAIKDVEAGVLLTVQGEIVEMYTRDLPEGGFVVGVVLSDDGAHVLEGVWFNQAHATRGFRYGQRLSFSGKPKWYRDRWQMGNPRVQVLDGRGAAQPGIVPIYPLTEDLRADHLRAIVAKALQGFAGRMPEIIPQWLREKHAWPIMAEALREIHLPSDVQRATCAKKRFAYEEFLVLQTALALRRREMREQGKAAKLITTPEIDERIRRLFPFDLTGDQNRAVTEICQDMASDKPMQRLLQADVGAGKTAVAVYALLVAVANKYQAVLMAPTEVLARQHAATLDRYLSQSRVRRLLLTGGLSTNERREALARLRAGEIDLIVGTQALIQDDVEFANLGLVIIDEQHKFGVSQRARVRRNKVLEPHYLVMTATPMPRTVALTVYGDLDVSVIKQMPPGRQAVQTRWVSENDRERIYNLLREGLTTGQQAFVICPLVEDAIQIHEKIGRGPLRDFRVGLLHGRQSEEEKTSTMEQFRRRQLDVLIATSVVEVGVDVPNAMLMLVENADRFGLSQLHQLRGRVSRGAMPGRCWLFAVPSTEDGKQRLRAILRTTDGFALAEEDLQMRGAGDLLGAQQHGEGDLRFGRLAIDGDLLAAARADARALLTHDPMLIRPEYEPLRDAVTRRYGKTLELAGVG